MKCPACSSKLSEITRSKITLDVCTESCGGVWFDARELDKVDELHEPVDSRVLRPLTNQKVAVDRNKVRYCPRCTDRVMLRQLEDSLNDIEIDCCPECGGVWLDMGELDIIRHDTTGKSERTKIIDDYLVRYAKDPANAPKGLRAVCRLIFG